MPGIYNLSIDEVIKEAKEVESLGIKSVILFGIPDHKDEEGSGAYGSDGIVQKAIKAIKDYTDLFRNKVIAGAIYPMYKGGYKLK